MNKLSSTHLYSAFSKVLKIENLYNEGFGKYIVPKDLFSGKINEFSRYKYPLSKYTRDSIINGKIVPIILQDPYQYQPGLKTYNTFPLFYFPIPTAIKDGKPVDLIVYTDTSIRGGYSRDKVSKIPQYYNIDVRDLYGLLQCASVIRGIRLNDAKITNSANLHKMIAEIYGELLAKAIDGNRRWSPTGGLPEKIALLKFLGIVFYFEQMVEKPKDKAIETALVLFKSFDRSYIESTCYYLKDDNYNISAAPLTKKISKAEEFCAVLKMQFPEITDLTYPNLNRVYKEMYGDNALLCLEDFGYFITMLQMVHLSYGMFRDRLIMSNYIVERLLNEILKTLAFLLEG